MNTNPMAEWRIYASVNETIIGKDSSMSPVWHQNFILTNDGLLLVAPLRTYLNES